MFNSAVAAPLDHVWVFIVHAELLARWCWQRCLLPHLSSMLLGWDGTSVFGLEEWPDPVGRPMEYGGSDGTPCTPLPLAFHPVLVRAAASALQMLTICSPAAAPVSSLLPSQGWLLQHGSFPLGNSVTPLRLIFPHCLCLKEGSKQSVPSSCPKWSIWSFSFSRIALCNCSSVIIQRTVPELALKEMGFSPLGPALSLSTQPTTAVT